MRNDILKHFGVKGMKWGVRRNSKSGGSSKSAKPKVKKQRSRIVREIKSLGRELHWMKYSMGMANMGSRDIKKVASRLSLENEMKRLTKEGRKTMYQRLTPTGRKISKKERADYLRRGEMSHEELSRKVNLLRAKSSLRREVGKASEEAREFGKKVVAVSADLAVKHYTGTTITKGEVFKSVTKTPKVKETAVNMVFPKAPKSKTKKSK